MILFSMSRPISIRKLKILTISPPYRFLPFVSSKVSTLILFLIVLVWYSAAIGPGTQLWVAEQEVPGPGPQL